MLQSQTSPWSTRYRETRLVSWTRLHRWRLSRSSGWEKHTISILKIIINKNKCLIHQLQCCSYIRLFAGRKSLSNSQETEIKYTTFNIFLNFCLFSLLISISSMFHQKQYKIHKLDNKSYLGYFPHASIVNRNLSIIMFSFPMYTELCYRKPYGCYRETRF